MVLPSGWYPHTAAGVNSLLKEWKEDPKDTLGIAGIVPHAGWAFSGKIAFSVIQRMNKQPDTVAVLGGHLYESGNIMGYLEHEFETPLGSLTSDFELLEELSEKLYVCPDKQADNTVEVQLPFVKYWFPNARILGLRVPPSSLAMELGKVLARLASDMGRTIVVLGSTDLTHYGPNYGFVPKGCGKDAERWVTMKNDKDFLDAVISMRFEEALRLSHETHCACSAGGAVAAAQFAAEQGIRQGELVAYSTSLAVHKDDSFVGYGGIVYSR